MIVKRLVVKDIKSFGYALEGLIFALKTQINFKIQLFIGFLASIFAFIFGFSGFEWIILLICICFVLFAELLNTAIEQLVDTFARDFHPQAKIVKDLSAGLVLLVSLFVFIIGVVLFVPHIIGGF